jgi:bacteriocin-like protein
MKELNFEQMAAVEGGNNTCKAVGFAIMCVSASALSPVGFCIGWAMAANC